MKPLPMDAFEIIVEDQQYKVIPATRSGSFNVFNHATFFIIRKNDLSSWEKVEHRFGSDGLPISLVGDAIDSYYIRRGAGIFKTH
jgi:hypothetical protein